MPLNAVKRRLTRPAPTAPRVEPLEDRTLLSTFWWIGSAPNPVTRQANLNWSAPFNWATTAKPGTLPRAGDTVIFSTTDPHNPRRVINANSFVDAGFGGIIGSLRIDAGFGGVLAVYKTLTVTNSFTQAGGNVAGPGTLDLHRSVLWYGGTESGTGTTQISGTQALGTGANSQIGAKPVTLDRRTLVVGATGGVLFGGSNGGANVSLVNGATLINQGASVLMTGPGGGLATITAPKGQGTFWNSGTLQVGLGPGRPTTAPQGGVIPPPLSPPVAFRLNVRFNDLGGVFVEPNAWLWVSGGGTSQGQYVTVASTRGQVGNVLFTGQGATAPTWDRASFIGQGSVVLAGDATVVGRTEAQNFTFLGGQLTLGSLAVGGTFSWLSGTLTGSGVFALGRDASGQIGYGGGNPVAALLPPPLAGALSSLPSGSVPTLAQSAVFSNAGSVALVGGGGDGLVLGGGSASHFDNTGTFTIQDSSGIGGGGGAVFNNLPGAVFQRANPQLAPSTISASFVNGGNKVPGGGLVFTALRQDSANAQLSLAGETITGVAPLVIQAGSVIGSGTLAGGVISAGTLLPGGAGLPGLLSVSGSLSEQDGGLISIDINGSAAGTGYDQVSATGPATLGGALTVTLNGYVPRPSDTFQILALPGGYSGTFAAANLPRAFGPGNAYGFQLVYDQDGVSLAVVLASGAPPTVGALDVSRGDVGGGAAVTITGSNFGDATAVTFGGVPALGFVVADSSHIIAVAPPNAPGVYDIRVTNALGQSPAVAADQFTYSAGVPAGPGPSAGGAATTVAAGQAFRATVAWFPGPLAAGSYTATIDWGNGTTTTGAVRATNAGLYRVAGGTTYAQTGTYTVTVTLTDGGGNTTTIEATFTVVAAAPDLGGLGPL